MTLESYPLRGFPSDGCVAYYKLDEVAGTTVTDSSPNGYDGLNSTVGINESGIINTSYTFPKLNGSYLEVPTNTDFQMDAVTDSYSVSIWVNSTTTNAFQQILNIGTNDVIETSAIMITNQWDSIAVRCSTASGQLILINVLASDYNVWDGEWHNIITTYDTNNMTMYIDGYAHTSSISLLTLEASTATTAPLFIGNRNNGTQGYGGKIDEVGIWNRALSHAEILAIYNSGNGRTY
jgi:hypothetical protein